MKIIALATQKGGAGKTTISAHLGSELTRQGFHVVLLDTDPQHTLTDWWNDREALEPRLLSVPYEKLQEALDALRQDGTIDFVVIDTPPQVTDLIRDIASLADLVVVPTKASPHDLRAAKPTLDLLGGLNKDIVFVVNEAKVSSKIARDVAKGLSALGPVMGTLHDRLDFVESMIDGRTAYEVSPDSKGAHEIRRLAGNLLKHLSIKAPKQASRSVTK